MVMMIYHVCMKCVYYTHEWAWSSSSISTVIVTVSKCCQRLCVRARLSLARSFFVVSTHVIHACIQYMKEIHHQLHHYHQVVVCLRVRQQRDTRICETTAANLRCVQHFIKLNMYIFLIFINVRHIESCKIGVQVFVHQSFNPTHMCSSFTNTVCVHLCAVSVVVAVG